MAEVLLTTNMNFQGFADATAYARGRGDAAEAARLAVQAQQQANNAQTAGILGRRSATSVATIGPDLGVYNITAGAEAGQVWERTSASTTVRREALEAASTGRLLSAEQRLEAPTLATAQSRGADATGTTNAAAIITSSLAAKVGRLGLGTFKTTATISIPSGVTLRGENSRDTVLRPDLPVNGYALQTCANPAANEWDAWQVSAEGLTLDGTGSPNSGTATGLRMGGAYRTVRDIRVKEFGVGVRYDQNHTYLNTLENFSVHSCIYGIVWEAGVLDSGENISLKGGAIFNNVHNLLIKSPDWFITLERISLDYPTTTQILVQSRVTLNLIAPHVENAASGVALLGAVNPDTDAGVILFDKGRFVNSAKPKSVTNDLVGPNVRSCVLVFQDCVDLPSGDRFTRAIWRMPGLPTTPATTAAPWTNTTGVTVRVRTRWTLTPAAGADAVVEGYSGPGTTGMPLRGTLFASRGDQPRDELLTIDVPNGYSVGYGAAGATAVSIEFEPLPG